MTAYETKTIERIRSHYEPREITKLDELKALDRKVKRPAEVFAYTFGTVGSLVLGTGMCFAMGVIGNLIPLGIAIGVVGIALVSLTYPLYKKILRSRRNRYSKEVFALSDSILNK